MLIASPDKAFAADDVQKRPYWSIEFKGGAYYLDDDQWDRFYGKSHTGQVGMALGYKFTRCIEAGIESYYIKDSGVGYLPENNTTGGDVTITMYPVNLFLLYRAVFNEDQTVVPYIGGGWTHMFYRQKISGQDNVEGSSDGYHLRAGLQLLLDNFDKGSSLNAADHGIDNTYMFLEVESIKVEDNATTSKLGGQLLSLGVLVEF